jgi:hypothetical protein
LGVRSQAADTIPRRRRKPALAGAKEVGSPTGLHELRQRPQEVGLGELRLPYGAGPHWSGRGPSPDSPGGYCHVPRVAAAPRRRRWRGIAERERNPRERNEECGG